MLEKTYSRDLFVFINALIICLAVAASKPQNDEQRQVLLDDKVKKLSEWSTKESVIRLTPDKFQDYIKAAPRNYSVVVMLTALRKERGCMICGQADEQFNLVANSWKYSKHFSNKLFFAMLDYDDNPNVFQMLKVQQVPLFIHFPAKGKRKKVDTMNMMSMDSQAEEMVKWIMDRTEIEFKVVRPINYVYLLSVTAALFVLGIALVFLRKRMHWVFNSTVSAIVVLIVIFAMISGYMWNQIRKPPRMHVDQRTGQLMYVSPNRGSQFIMETYVIMLLYGAMLVGFIMMNEIGSLKKRWGKIVLALAGLVCVVFFFIQLLTVFKKKSPYYPYGFSDLLEYLPWK
ncbi:hypothetical protein ACOMHN_048036 [Nucella lapillus]